MKSIYSIGDVVSWDNIIGTIISVIITPLGVSYLVRNTGKVLMKVTEQTLIEEVLK